MKIVVFVYGLAEPTSTDGHGLQAIAQIVEALPDVRTVVCAWDEDLLTRVMAAINDDPEWALEDAELFLVGHSFGGSKCVEFAERLTVYSGGVEVQHLFLLDPVPHVFPNGAWNSTDFILPDNVERGTCWFRPRPRVLPCSLPIRGVGGMYENRPCPDVGHSEFGWLPEVKDAIVEAVSR